MYEILMTVNPGEMVSDLPFKRSSLISFWLYSGQGTREQRRKDLLGGLTT